MSALDVIRALVLPDGRPFGNAMAPYQRSDFKALLAPDAPPNAWISRPRGGSKTTDVAALALSDLMLAPDNSRLFAVAGDLDQAKILADLLQRWTIDSGIDGLSFTTTLISNPATGTTLKILPSDAPTSLGLSPYRIYCDELAAWPSGDMWATQISSAHKAPGCRIFVLTTAGSPASWSFRLWESVQDSPRWQVLHTAELPPWVDFGAVDDARLHLPEGLYERYFENRWTVADEAPFTARQVDELTDYGRPPAFKGDGKSTYYIGADFGRVNDAACISVVRADPAREAHEHVLTWWKRGSREAPVRVAEFEEALTDIRQRFYPSTVFADPWQLEGTIERLSVEAFNFTGQSKAALSASFVSLIREGRLRLLDDPDLRAELMNLAVKENSRGGWTIEAARGHDDRVIALAVAATQADTHARGRESWRYCM